MSEYVQNFYADADGNFLGSYAGPDEDRPPQLIGAIKVHSAPGDASQKWNGNAWVERAMAPLELIAYAADARWRAETRGLAIAGMPVASDDRSKTMIIGARVKADGDPAFTTRWKAPDGSFATIDAATIILISDAMLQHVADCFAAEDAVISAIEAGEIATAQQVDAMISQGISQQQAARE